jgi:hypothetical protein
LPNLPAPYVSPWREFGRNLRALAADLRLRIQELWRRNGEGDLPQPGFWPRQLAAFFWPALLVLLLALAVVALMQRSASSAPSPGPPPASPSALPSASPPAPAVAPDVSLDVHQDSAPLTQVDSPGNRAADSAPAPEPEPASEPASAAEPISEPQPRPSVVPSLLLAETADPFKNQLRLTLSLTLWRALSSAERDQRALAWLRSAEEKGFDSIALVDEEDRPLGRSARVGDGMILFDRPGAA